MDDAGNFHNNQKPSILTKQQGLQANDPACTSTNIITTDGDGGLSSRKNDDAVQHLVRLSLCRQVVDCGLFT